MGAPALGHHLLAHRRHVLAHVVARAAAARVVLDALALDEPVHLVDERLAVHHVRLRRAEAEDRLGVPTVEMACHTWIECLDNYA